MKFYNNQPRVEKVIAIFQNILIFWRVLVFVEQSLIQGDAQMQHLSEYGTIDCKIENGTLKIPSVCLH